MEDATVRLQWHDEVLMANLYVDCVSQQKLKEIRIMITRSYALESLASVAGSTLTNPKVIS